MSASGNHNLIQQAQNTSQAQNQGFSYRFASRNSSSSGASSSNNRTSSSKVIVSYQGRDVGMIHTSRQPGGFHCTAIKVGDKTRYAWTQLITNTVNAKLPSPVKKTPETLSLKDPAMTQLAKDLAKIIDLPHPENASPAIFLKINSQEEFNRIALGLRGIMESYLNLEALKSTSAGAKLGLNDTGTDLNSEKLAVLTAIKMLENSKFAPRSSHWSRNHRPHPAFSLTHNYEVADLRTGETKYAENMMGRAHTRHMGDVLRQLSQLSKGKQLYLSKNSSQVVNDNNWTHSRELLTAEKLGKYLTVLENNIDQLVREKGIASLYSGTVKYSNVINYQLSDDLKNIHTDVMSAIVNWTYEFDQDLGRADQGLQRLADAYRSKGLGKDADCIESTRASIQGTRDFLTQRYKSQHPASLFGSFYRIYGICTHPDYDFKDEKAAVAAMDFEILKTSAILANWQARQEA